MDTFIRLGTDRPRLTIGLVLVLTVFAASRIVDFRSRELRLTIDPSVDRLLPEGDETRRYYDRVREIFGNDETILVALVSDRLFTPEVLRRVERLTARIEALEGIDRVVSLFTALEIRGENDALVIEPFIGEEIPEDPEALDQIRRSVLESPVYGGSLVSRDGRATALLVHLQTMAEEEFIFSGLDRRITAIAEEERGDAEIWIAGAPHTKVATSELLLSDFARILPLGAALLALTAFVAFRTLRGVVVPLTTIAIANTWTLGTMAAFGYSINLVTVVIPALIQTVGFAYTVHVVSEYYDFLRHETVEPGSAATRALRELTLPLLLTAVTTAAGLLSLTLSPMTAVREFGTVAVVGVIYTMIAAATFAPAVLQLGRPRPPARGIDDALGALAERLARFDVRHRKAIFLGAGLVAVIALIGITRIRVNTDFVTNFAPDHPVRRDYESINENLAGAGNLQVVIEAEDDEAFKEPKNLRELDALQRWLEAQPEVGSTTSLADYVKVINWGFHDNDPTYRAIPETREIVAQLLLFGDNRELELVIDSSYRAASVGIRASARGSGAYSALIDRIEERLAELPGDLHGRTTGYGVLLARTVDDVSRTQALSLSFALVVIYLVLAALFTSFRIGLVALIPNALPILFYFGLLGWTGITLNATTALISVLALGIAVDDTIHYFARFNATARRLGDELAATVHTLRAVGRPVTVTSVALCLGFVVLVTAQLKNQAEFGGLTAATLAFAWATDVLLTPALCARLRIVTLWDSLTLDLGAEPTSTIPLFHGLSTRQARIVCLMASIRTFAAGEQVFRQGERGSEMYIVIDGELKAFLRRPEREIMLNTHGRGSVIGEVALQYGTRTADVDALTDVRALQITKASLERLGRRYPRIAVIVWRNLNEVLAQRTASNLARIS